MFNFTTFASFPILVSAVAPSVPIFTLFLVYALALVFPCFPFHVCQSFRFFFQFYFTVKAFILCPVSFYFLSCLFPDCYHLLNVCASILFTLLCLIYNQPFVCVCVYSRVIFLVSFIKLYVLLSDSFVSFWICSPPLVLLLPLYFYESYVSATVRVCFYLRLMNLMCMW